MNKKNFQKILKFYLFNCPCEIEKGSKKDKTKTYTKVSEQGKTLREQGWTKGKMLTLLAAMKKTSSGKLEFYSFNTSDNILSEARQVQKNSKLKDDNFEMIVISKRNDMPITSAIFYYIRNAFAHGSFSVDGNTYCFESSKNSKIKAVIRLRENTLLDWIKCFSVSPAVLKNAIYSSKQNSKRNKRRKVAA